MLEWIVSSSVLILFVLLIRALFGRRMSAGLRYGLWALVLLRLLLPVSIGASAYSVSAAVDRAEASAPAQAIRQTLEENRSYSAVLRDSELSYAEAEAREDLGQLHEVQGYPADGPKGKLHTYIYKDSLSVILRRALPWLWLVGIVCLALYFLVKNLVFYARLRRDRVLLREERPKFWAVPELASSCLFGLFLPGIYVSDTLAGEEAALAHVLAHESAHYRHLDQLWSLLRCLTLILHWYNPLVWLAAALSRRDAELFADAGALSRLGEAEREPYGLTLLRLSAGYGRRVSLFSAATTMNGGKRTLRERVKRIAKSPRLTAAVLLPVLLLTLAAAGCAFLGKQKEAPTEGEKTDRVLFLSHSLMEYAMNDSISMRELLLYENGSLQRLDSLYDLSPSTFFVRGDTAYWADSECRAVYRLDALQPEPRAEIFASLPGVLVNQLYVTREGRLFLLYQVYNAEEGRASPGRLGELLPDGSLVEAYDGDVFLRNGFACKWITEDEENLYFISLVDLSPRGLVKLNKQTGEWTAKEDPRFWEALYYDEGFVYSATANGTPVRYRVSTGEVEELTPVGPFVPRDGWLYSILSVPGEGQSYELARTDPETGERQSYGTIRAAYVPDLVPRECLAFTDTGFIFHAISAEDGHSPLYLYFSYDGTENRELKVMKLYWEGRSRITMPAGTIWEMNLRTESERVDESWEIWCDESLGSIYWRDPLSGPAADHSLRLVLDTHSAIPEAKGRLYAQKGEALRWIDVELGYQDLAYFTQPVASPDSYILYDADGPHVYYEEVGRTVYLLNLNSRYRILSADCYASHISVSLAEDGMSITITADDELTGDLDAQIIYDVEVDGSNVYQYKEMLRFRSGEKP